MIIAGQLEKAQLEQLSSDPTGDDLYEGRIWINTTDKLMKMADADGNVVVITGQNAEDLTISSGTQYIPAGVNVFKDLTIASGATLKVSNNVGDPTILYVNGDLTVNGTLEYKNCYHHGRVDIVDIPGIGKTTVTISQAAGGAGGAGGSLNRSGGAGGASANGFGGGGGSGCIELTVISTAGADGSAGATVGANASAGSGNGTGYANGKGGICVSNFYDKFPPTFSLIHNSASIEFAGNGQCGIAPGGGAPGGTYTDAGATQLGGAGGGGAGCGNKGLHGGVLFIVCTGTVSGSGTIDVAGTDALDTAGDGGNAYSDGINPIGACGGGGGGGAAGGSGGYLKIYYGTANSLTASEYDIAEGNGSSGGSGGTQDGSGNNGAAGSNGSNGTTGTYSSTAL